MWRFIRRLFILLVLFTIAFLIYRYINPDWASRLVDKIKSIPDRFVSSDTEWTWENLNVTDTTLFITWDVDVSVETWEDDMTWLQELNQEIEQILGNSDDKNTIITWDIDLTNCLTYFDGCNNCAVVSWEVVGCTKMFCEKYEEPKCLEYIEDQEDQQDEVDLEKCVSYFDGCNTCVVVSGEISWCTRMYCEKYEEAKCLEYVWDSEDEETNTEENSNNVEDQETNSWEWEAEQQWLSDIDYQQIEDVFGNLVE